MNKAITLCLLSLVLSFSALGASTTENLTVRLAVDPDWYPYEFINETGQYVGIASDLLSIIADRAGLHIEIVPTSSWSESVELAKDGSVDGLAFLNKTEVRQQYLIFTKPYFTDPNVIITREEHPYIADPASLSNESVALPAQTSVGERMRNDYPNLLQIIVESEEEAIALVEQRKAHMTVRSLTMAAHVIKDQGLFNLKIAGQLPGYENQLRIGLRKDLDHVVVLLDEAIDTLTREEVTRVVNEYVSINVQQGFDYRLFILVFLGFSCVLILVVLWLRYVQKLNQKLTVQRNTLAQLSKKLQQSENLYKSVVKASPDAIIISEKNGTIIMASSIANKLVGEDEGVSLQGRNIKEFIHGESHALLKENLSLLYEHKHPGRSEYTALRSDGSTFFLEANSELLFSPDGKAKQLVTVARDITNQKQIEHQLISRQDELTALAEHLKHLNAELLESSTVDALTALKNRRYFNQAISEAKRHCDEGGNSFALLLIDLDRFKLINDTFGHAKGDEVIVTIANAMKKCVKTRGELARWGGEEFAILFVIETKDQALTFAKELHTHIRCIEHLDVGQVFVSIGLGFYAKGERLEQLFKRTDDALYRAKITGRNRICTEEDLSVPTLNSDHIVSAHRQLLVLIAKTTELVFSVHDTDSLCKALENLLEQLQVHFEEEERLLFERADDRIETHKAGHQKVIQLLLDAIASLEAGTQFSDVAWFSLLNQQVLWYLLVEDSKIELLNC